MTVVTRSLSLLQLALAGILATALAVASAFPALGLDIEFGGRAVKRDVLVLYDSAHERAPHETRVHKLAEMPLNHLGFRLTYHDVNKGLPPVASLKPYRGVLTWFLEPLKRPDQLLAWLDEATQGELAYVMLGEIAPSEPEAMLPVVNRILGRLGLQQTGDYVELTYKSRIADQSKAMIGFERPVDKVLPGFPVRVARSREAVVHLSIRTPAARGETVSAVVVTSPRGGVAPNDYATSYDGNTERVRWIIDPFAFFKAALGPERFPVPDVTTVSGRRIYFSHIDGDGWNNLTEVEKYRSQQMSSSEVILREIIQPFPDLPVSVGLIGGDVEPALGGFPDGARVARLIYGLPQVEVATHTYTHPYAWHYFETYERAKEEVLIARYKRTDEPWRERLSATLLRLAGKQPSTSQFDPYVAGNDELPRSYLREPFDLEKEIAGAVAASERLAPPGRKTMIYLWSGDTTPFEAAIKATRRAGVRNINGGDSRLDAEYPSVAYVPPIARPAGAERQIYAANSNENTYTNEWTGPHFGQLLLEHTLRNVDSPRRLKAFNLYYHMYSGEKAAALAAIRHFVDKARGTPVVPLPASGYAAIADDYFGVEIEQVHLDSWAVRKRGALQTVRFDDATEMAVDLERSFGVLGATRHNNALYVALDASADRAVIAMRPGEGVQPVALGKSAAIALLDSRWQIRGLERSGCGMTFTAQGFGPGEMRWLAPPGRAFTVTAAEGDRSIEEMIVRSGADGIVDFKLGPIAMSPVTVRWTCHE